VAGIDAVLCNAGSGERRGAASQRGIVGARRAHVANMAA